MSVTLRKSTLSRMSWKIAALLQGIVVILATTSLGYVFFELDGRGELTTGLHYLWLFFVLAAMLAGGGALAQALRVTSILVRNKDLNAEGPRADVVALVVYFFLLVIGGVAAYAVRQLIS